jgi:hypothetical protein
MMRIKSAKPFVLNAIEPSAVIVTSAPKLQLRSVIAKLAPKLQLRSVIVKFTPKLQLSAVIVKFAPMIVTSAPLRLPPTMLNVLVLTRSIPWRLQTSTLIALEFKVAFVTTTKFLVRDFFFFCSSNLYFT